MVSRRPKRAAGTYGLLDVLQHPSRLLRPARPSESGDIEAIRRGEGRAVSCFLRGQVDPFPQRLKQGTLVLQGSHASWIPYWALRRHPLGFDLEVLSVESRPADHREPNVKKGGTAFGTMQVPTFMVVSCGTSTGAVDFVIPAADEPLVKTFFNDRIGHG